MDTKDITCAFFGGEPLAIPTLEALKKVGLLPKLIVTNPDRPSGRSQELTPPPAKIWAQTHNIPVYQPDSFKEKGAHPLLENNMWDVFLVAAYNMILPKWLIDTPTHGTLNLHPSLLPKLRGASPIRSAILENIRETGVTIMHMDEKMDHGPIVAQEKIETNPADWPFKGTALDTLLGTMGATLLADITPKWIAGEIEETQQNHEEATYTKKFTREDGLIDLLDDPYKNLLKIRAFEGFPGTYFFIDTQKGKMRVKIIDAELGPDGQLHILRVIPEGKKEMSYDEFKRNMT